MIQMDWANIYNREAYDKLRTVMDKYFKVYPNKFIKNYIIKFDYDKNKDLTEATDVIATISNKIQIAMRMRDLSTYVFQKNPNLRELTLRSQKNGHQETELKKIREGFADLYFYGFVNTKNHWAIKFVNILLLIYTIYEKIDLIF